MLVRHEAVFDGTRVLRGKGEGVVKQFLVENPDRTTLLEPFLDESSSEVIRLMDENPGTKVRYVLKVHLRDLNNEEEPEKEFVKGLRSTQIETRPKGENERVYFGRVRKEVLQSFEDMKREKSNLVLSFVEYGEITFSKVNNIGVAGHFTPLPKYLRTKKAIINIQNKDEFCFKWAITRALNLENANNVRVTPFLREKADWSGVSFPVSLDGQDISAFERNSKIGIAIYTCSEEDGEYAIYRHTCPQEKFGKIVNLFAMKLPEGEKYDYHFCVVRYLGALLRCDGKVKKVVCCSYCPARFYNKIGIVKESRKPPRKGVIRNANELCIEHEKVCPQVTDHKMAPQDKLPKPGENILEFKKWNHLFQNPMLGVADFESALVNHYEVRGGNTICMQEHRIVAYSLKFVSDIPGLQFERRDYRGKNAAKRFVQELRQIAGEIQERFPSYGIPARSTEEEERRFDKETHCFACGEEFMQFDAKKRKVFDHNHFTGNNRSAMCNACNRQCKDTRTFSQLFWLRRTLSYSRT